MIDIFIFFRIFGTRSEEGKRLPKACESCWWSSLDWSYGLLLCIFKFNNHLQKKRLSKVLKIIKNDRISFTSIIFHLCCQQLCCSIDWFQVGATPQSQWEGGIDRMFLCEWKWFVPRFNSWQGRKWVYRLSSVPSTEKSASWPIYRWEEIPRRGGSNDPNMRLTAWH